ncbi:MAG: ABC transporter permease [Proteobacteria bacterium]|nr:ABC transporter permease [Pseudomonadota bacterium]
MGSLATWSTRALLVLLYLFLLAPILLVFPMSFSDDAFLGFPPQSWSFRWYWTLLANQSFIDAFWVSVAVGALVTLVCLTSGVPAAYAIARYRFWGREALYAFFTAPLLLPSIVLGLAILLVFFRLALTATYAGLVLAHVVVTLPIVVRIIVTSIGGLPDDLEDAAATLGAPPWRVFARVTLPLILPGMLASSALAFLLSFDEVVISLFVVGPRLTTLPIAVFRYVQFRTDPQIAALAVVIILGSMLIAILVERSFGLMRAFGR